MTSEVVDAVRAAGGEVYAITSEPQTLATRARDDWQTQIEHVGDPHQEIAADARARGWLDLRVQENTELLQAGTSWEIQHPKGYYQPGVIALDREQRVLYRWQSVPSRKNVGGATSRPLAPYVWEQIQAARARQTAEDSKLDENPQLDSPPAPFPLFALILLAHGWFIRPRVFSYQGDGEDPTRKIPKARNRLVGFVLMWILAFLLLPVTWVMTALVIYLPVAAYGVYQVYTRFQNEQRAASYG